MTGNLQFPTKFIAVDLKRLLQRFAQINGGNLSMFRQNIKKILYNFLEDLFKVNLKRIKRGEQILVAEMKTEIKRRGDTIAQYITIPRDIVMDDIYPFDREADIQDAMVIIDKESNSLIIKPLHEKK